MKAIKKYIDECVHELRQVTWPTKNQAIRISIITMIFVVASAVLIGLLDLILTKLILLAK